MENGEAPKAKKKRTAKQTAKIIDRGSKILEYRKQGHSLREISGLLKADAKKRKQPTRGFSHEQVRQDFKEIVELRLDEQQETLDEIRMISAERLEKVLVSYMPYVEQDIDKLTSDNLVRMKIKAGDTVIRAIKEFNELYGVKRPQKIEHSGEIEFNWAQIAKEANDFSNLTDEDHE